ncbi:MAG: NADP-dependent oxidoreductase, partial [Emcibacteraceae bacterium]|nr:NADP-dependent oxidoreductase [Emcibacteraceae bacterium]
LSYSLGVSLLGMTGFSAYCGFIKCGFPKSDDVVLVSGAGGGVGSIVVQIAKILGCKVIGIAGGEGKCKFVSSLGADLVIDYKNDDVAKKINEFAPTGLDVYFDNVGGEILAAALENLTLNARVVLCGSISEYMRDEPFGLTNYTKLRSTNSSMHGFFVYNHETDFKEAEENLARWINEGKILIEEDITDGFEQMPLGLQNLYAGKNKGVALCKILDDSEFIFD